MKSCSNVRVNPASCVESKQREEELDLVTPKTLNFEEKGGEDKNDDNTAPKKDGAPQPPNLVNLGDTDVDSRRLRVLEKCVRLGLQKEVLVMG